MLIGTYATKNSAHFFETARERYNINKRRAAGEPKPWTFDEVYREWRFCNVHREDDKTTIWFRDNIRDPLVKSGADWYHIAAATLTFRWFNRIESGELIKDTLLDPVLVKHHDLFCEALREKLRHASPVVTGAFMVSSPAGYDKLTGIAYCIEQCLQQIGPWSFDWEVSLVRPTLRSVWKQLKSLPYLGGFMAYEIITDLRWTPILDKAGDIMEWCNPGPGARRGLGWIMFDDNTVKMISDDMQDVMRELLLMSADEQHWPGDFRPWEMREVEHWLCEYDKYRRAASGQNQKRRFDGR